MMNITIDMLKDIESHRFILNQHDVVIDGEIKTHWDIKIPGVLIEWKMVKNPVEFDNVLGIGGRIPDISKVEDTGDITIGSVETEVTRVDTGEVKIVDTTYVFDGDRLNGAWATEQDPNIPQGKIFSRAD